MERIRFYPMGLLICWSALAFGVAACSSADEKEPSTTQRSARVLSFSVNPETIHEAGDVTLRWEVSDEEELYLLANDEAVSLDDLAITTSTAQVSIARTTVFELIVVGAVGEPVRERRTVEYVELLDPPSIASFTGPEVVGVDAFGDASAVLSWTGVVGAAELTLEAGSLASQPLGLELTPDGSLEVTLREDKTFSLIASNEAGEASEEVAIRVVRLPSIVSLDADRLHLGTGEEVEVSWETLDSSTVELWANELRLEDLDEALTSGSFSLPIDFDTTLELRAFNEVGAMVTRTIEISVGAPVLTEVVDPPATLWLGESVEFAWTSEGASTAIVTAGTGERTEVICEATTFNDAAEKSCSWTPASIGTYLLTLEVHNPSGSDERSWTVMVGDGPRITSFEAEPAALTDGESLRLSWTTLADIDGEAPVVTIVDDRGVSYPHDEPGAVVFTPGAGPGIYTFTLLAETSHELSRPVQATAQVEVFPLPAVSLEATPTHFDDSESEEVVLSWTSRDAVRLTLYQLTDAAPIELAVIPEAERAAGSFSLVPADAATYRLVATNAIEHEVHTDAAVTLAPLGILSFEALPRDIVGSQGVELQWRTRMAQEVTLNILEAPYLREDTGEPYIDAQALGGTHLPLSAECGGGDPAVNGCAQLDFPDGFVFAFGGIEHRSARVFYGGALSFDFLFKGLSVANRQFPTGPTASNYHLAALWGSLAFDKTRYPAGNIYTLLRKDEQAGDSLIIQWKDSGFNGNARASINLEIILWEDGAFEYRYGTMDVATTLPDYKDWGRFTVGYQSLDQAHFDNINYNRDIRVLGPHEHRAFRYTPTWTLPKDGSFTWHPLATSDTETVILTARRGENVDTRSIPITVRRQPEIEIVERPTAPLEIDTNFTLRWQVAFASRVEVLDADGRIRCETTSPQEIEQGFCLLQEAEEAIHRYRLRATGDLGFQLEKEFTATIHEPFGIVSFTSDRDFLEIGDKVLLQWETFNAPQISLVANDKEYLPGGAPSGLGELEVGDLPKGSTFVLRVTNGVGVSREQVLFVDLWKVRLGVTPSTTTARPGVPFTISIDAAALDDGPVPTVLGTFPLEEKIGAQWDYLDISGTEGATQLSPNTNIGYAALNFPEGFQFPFQDQVFSGNGAGRIMVYGYISFGPTAAARNGNQILPYATIRDVNLAPMWDALRAYSNASIWTKQIGPDTFVIQWKGMSFNLAGVSDANQANINFQVHLHRNGGFEYRYGTLGPLQTDLPANRCYPHNNCAAEVQGASATIGYQQYNGDTGFTHHFGGGGNAAANTPYPGGLNNRTFVYEPIVGSKTLTFVPDVTRDYLFCTRSGDLTVCKTQRIVADFGIDSFAPEASKISFPTSTRLTWTTHGATTLIIRDHTGATVFTTEDTAIIDAGSFEVTPLVNTSYELEIRAAAYVAKATTAIEVSRMTLALTAPTDVFPGLPISLSWTMNKLDGGMNPVVISPMGEIAGAPFSQWDLTQAADVTSLFAPNLATGLAKVEFAPDFSFPYLGQPMTDVHVSLEGFLSFDPTAASVGTNQSIPNSTLIYQRAHIAPFWDDLHEFSAGQVLAKRVDADTYVIQWSRMSLQSGATAANAYDLNFQAVLRRSGDFEFRYGTMREPPNPIGTCRPTTCVGEANGASATIGYQHPSLLLGSMVHFATAGGIENAVPGGLTGRTFRFQASAAGGTVQVPAWNTASYRICAFDPVTFDTVCSNQEDVSVRWGVDSFTASSQVVVKDAPVSLAWEVTNLDELRITANGTEIHRLVGAAIPATGSIVHNPSVNTAYVLTGVSVGREIVLQQDVEIRTFDLNLQGPLAPGFPGDLVTLTWSTTQLEPGEFHLLPPLVEIPAGPGQAGEYRDISGEVGVTLLSPSNATAGFASVDLPFPFPYFGQTYSKLSVFIDGFLSFDLTKASGPPANEKLPAGGNNDMVHLAPFWDDLNVRGPDKLHTFSPDPQTLIIQWSHFNRNLGSSATVHYDLNFQVVLRSNGSFEYRYGTMAPPATPANQTACTPSSCAVEAQGGSATIAYQVPGVNLAYNHHVGGNYFESTFAPEGGLSNRTFGYSPSTSGSTLVPLGRNRTYEVCGFTPTFATCESVGVRVVAEPGDLMITEVMIDPTSGASGQWFEVRNLTDAPIDLNGFTIRNERGSHPIASAVSVPPRGFVTLAASAAALPQPNYVYGPLIELAAVADDLSLRAGTAAISEVHWDSTWSVPRGQSLGVDPSRQLRTVVQVPDRAFWCQETGSGSPGVLGWGCTSPFYSVDPSSDLSFYDITDSGTRLLDLEANNAIAEIPVTGFSMPFFTGTVRKVWASANGWVSFSEDRIPTGGNTSPTVAQVPRAGTASPAGPLVAAYWQALQCNKASWNCSFHYQQTELTGKRVLILQWNGYRPSGGAGSLRFQLQLWEDGDVVVAFAEAASSQGRGVSGFRYYWGELTWIGMEGQSPLDYLTAFHRSQLDMSYRTFHFRRR